MIFHRAGVNASAAPRRAVNHVFTRPFIAQQISFPSMLDGRYSDDAELARLLGYGIGTVPSVSDWWERRRRRALRGRSDGDGAPTHLRSGRSTGDPLVAVTCIYRFATLGGSLGASKTTSS
jgi:hypothetical protein